MSVDAITSYLILPYFITESWYMWRSRSKWYLYTKIWFIPPRVHNMSTLLIYVKPRKWICICKGTSHLLTVICPCITNIFPNYNQQDATFLDLFISTDALHVSGGSSAHHQEHITVHTASDIVNQYCCASSSIGWQYLKLYVQLCAPHDGRRNRLKHAERL